MTNTTLDKIAAVVHAYDVRGVVPSQFDADMAHIFGRVFALFWKNQMLMEAEKPGTSKTSTSKTDAPKILCGRDMRSSGQELSQAFCEGVRSQAVGVVDLGLISSDLLYFASGDLDLPGAIFTASHNPSEYNGIKFCGRAAAPIGKETGLDEICNLAAQFLDPSNPSNPSLAPEKNPLPPKIAPLEKIDMLDGYVKHVKSQIDFESLAPLKVVADTANGMGGLVVPAVFESANPELDLMYGELDGSFPNHPPNPLDSKNLKDLIGRVLDTKADVGLAFDGDADRVFLVDDKGSPISGSTTTALIAASILRRSNHPNKQQEVIAYNLICSKVVPEVIEELGGQALKTKVGHSYIKQVMAESGAAFAGEHSGHYYFRENFGADSGMIAALHILELMSQTGEPLSQLKKPFEKYVNMGEFNFQAADPAQLIEHVSKHYSQYPQDRLDGLTVDLGDWWFNLRPSNTEPMIRLNLEAGSEKTYEIHMREVQDVLSS